MELFNQHKKKFGSVTSGSTELVLTQNPFLSDDGQHYESSAASEQQLSVDNYDPSIDPGYQVYWEIHPGFDLADHNDEADACDWDTPSSIRLIGDHNE